jgi:hypothetical protein
MLDTKTRAAVVVALCSFFSPTLVYAKDCDTLAEKKQCCSKKKCDGKVLSNRDAHNCKDTSKGKSWHPASDGTTAAQCTDL